jgi:Fe-S cluster biogenesis protein NfuA
MGNPIDKRVEEAIETIRPAVQMDGGDVELVSVEDNVVVVRMSGACSGCAMANVTLKQGIEATVREAVPEIERVDAIFY